MDGLVCRRKLAHKRMPSRVVQPRIMMLASTLEYHRTQHKLSSFDTLLQQASFVPVSRHLPAASASAEHICWYELQGAPLKGTSAG